MGTKAKTAKKIQKAKPAKSVTAIDRLLPKGRVYGPHTLPEWAIKAARTLLKKVPNATAVVFEDSWVYAIEPSTDGSGYVCNSTGVRFEVHEMSVFSPGKPELLDNCCDYPGDGNPTEWDAIVYASLCAEQIQEMQLENGTYKSANLPRTIVQENIVLQGLIDYSRTQSSAA